MSKKQTLVVSGTLLLLLIGGIWLYLSQQNDSGTPNNSDQSSEINTPTHPDTAEVKEPANETNDQTTTDNPQYVPVISRISQDGDTVFVRAYVSTFNEGECKLEMTKEDTTITDTSGVSPQPSYLQCEGFDVEKSELGANYQGEWQIKVIYQINGQDYESDIQNLTVS